MFLHILPLILLFLLGYFLKRIKLLDLSAADLLLKLVFNVSLPALIILSVSGIDLQAGFILLPISAVIIVLITYVVSYVLGNILKLNKTTFGVYLVGAMIMNMAFVYPFVIAAYGAEGLARAVLFDFGNGAVTLTFVYFIACKYGSGGKSSELFKKLLISPPIWGLIIGLVLNISGLRIPLVLENFLHMAGDMTIALIMLSLGIYLNLNLKGALPLLSSAVIRSGFGLLAGLALVSLFGLEGIIRKIVLISSAAPVGFNTLTFSAMENLDKEFAAKLVSFSTLAGIIIIPLLITILD
ncbi:MAG: AEC family transporter [FCB group bacterium]|nr:AEC family transporter [FCB group bacterium]